MFFVKKIKENLVGETGVFVSAARLQTLSVWRKSDYWNYPKYLQKLNFSFALFNAISDV